METLEKPVVHSMPPTYLRHASAIRLADSPVVAPHVFGQVFMDAPGSSSEDKARPCTQSEPSWSQNR